VRRKEGATVNCQTAGCRRVYAYIGVSPSLVCLFNAMDEKRSNLGLSIVVAVAANTRGRSPIAWFIYAIIFSPLLSGLLLLALPNLSNSFAAGRMYLEGELREFEERRRRRAIVARIAAVCEEVANSIEDRLTGG
jgi:hypothetical protein